MLLVYRKRNLTLSAVAGMLFLVCLFSSCHSGRGEGVSADGDTLSLKYAHLLTMVDYGDYTEVTVANPWQADAELHRYLLVPKGKEGDETARRLSAMRNGGRHQDIVRTPVENSVVFTAPHCQLMYDLHVERAIRGVCDMQYVNIADLHSRKDLVDCGSGMQPDIERIIELHPEALLISPFENSGGYGKLDKLGIPIIETADYMEYSPLGRAEWMKFYALLFGCKAQADSLFGAVEKAYLSLCRRAAAMPVGRSVLTERKTQGVWYVPGGKSTIGILLHDAHARYVWAGDTHSGSLALAPEQVIDHGDDIDVWAFKRYGGNRLTAAGLLAEYPGYAQLRAFREGNIYQCDTGSKPFFELTPFHPDLLLREFIILAHPQETSDWGKLQFFSK